MRLLTAALLLLPVASPAFANPDGVVTPKADQIGQVFCLSRTGNDTALISGILTATLRAAIEDAESRSEAWAKAHPDEKPPLGDGVPWQSAPDYAPNCTVGLVSLMKTDARVELKYDFPDAPAAGFIDTLILKRIETPDMGGSFWRIDNVLFPDGTDMRGALAAAFAGYE